MRHFVLAGTLAIAACNQSDQKDEVLAQRKAPQCTMDTQCKGDRICESGNCVAPPKASVAPETVQQSKAPASDGVPVCEANDRRKKIPVWTPKVDANGNLSSDPPTKDGQITYIELWTEADKVTCKDKELNSFSRPKNARDAMEGGLAVNLRGNTQFANGMCYFKGYYMNEDVMGMHQGWVETYFGKVDKEKVVLSDKFCLARPIP